MSRSGSRQRMLVLKILTWFRNHLLETDIGMSDCKCQTALQSRDQGHKQWLWVWVAAALLEETDGPPGIPFLSSDQRSECEQGCSVLSTMVRTGKLPLTCNRIKGLLCPNPFEEYTHNLINTLVAHFQLFPVNVQSSTSPQPYSLV